ncbi:hypothetical protein GCM10022384_67360 [Streptomyces marokkonensis]|uniref:Uncharacterized protein n=1 Tax=Streptomyces marokkonensis TaxID=324855 RepID=A0ABP7SLV3_9ACTN
MCADEDIRTVVAFQAFAGVCQRGTARGPRRGAREHIPEPCAQPSTDGADPGSGRPADSDMNHTATPPTTAAAIM